MLKQSLISLNGNALRVCWMADLSSRLHLPCPWIFQTAVLINLCYAESELRAGYTNGSCWWGAVPKCSFQGHCPAFKAKPWWVWPPKDLLSFHPAWIITALPGMSSLRRSSPALERNNPILLPQCVYPAPSPCMCPAPVQAISTAALTSSGVFGRICQVICISWLEKLYLGHQAVREGKLISHPAPSLPQPAAGTGPPGPC